MTIFLTVISDAMDADAMSRMTVKYVRRFFISVPIYGFFRINTKVFDGEMGNYDFHAKSHFILDIITNFY